MALVELVVDGQAVSVPAEGTLLEAVRERSGIRSVKDGCSPQGQCGCCTVLVDGVPRVSCVTPVRRVAGREITTLDGLDDADRQRWIDAVVATGASQCGFCTPGIIVRLEAARRGRGLDRPTVDRALAAHLCRCTGWQPICEAAELVGAARAPAPPSRDLTAASRRATIEGGGPQQVTPDVAAGRGGFADDTAPDDALVAVPAADGGWAVAETLVEARARAGTVQGRRSTVPVSWPIEVPPGAVTALQTTWVEPAPLEVDASWCAPDGEPASPLANGGAFGAKRHGAVERVAFELSRRHGRCVRVLATREWTIRHGPKRPPMAIGVDERGHLSIRVARTPGIADLLARIVPRAEIREVDVAGPPTSVDLRAVGWAEVAVARAAAGDPGAGPHASSGASVATVEAPSGARARAEVGDELVAVEVACGELLDEVVARSYVIGAVHQALGWVRSEALAVDDAGLPVDLTIRSLGVLRSGDMPRVDVHLDRHDRRDPVPGGDAAFAAVAAAAHLHAGAPGRLPVAAVAAR